jgi:DDE superfamily endonuclease
LDRIYQEVDQGGAVRVEAITGLVKEQVDEVVRRVSAHLGSGEVARPGGRPCALGLYDSVVLVIHLLRRNPVQAVAAGFLNVSQATVSRRWDLLRPVIAEVLADLTPAPRAMIRAGTALVDGTVCPTWDGRQSDDLYSVKAGYAGMNVQIACSMDGDLAAIGPVPLPGARHDAYAYAASGLKDLMNGIHQLADLGYVGVEGIDIVPYKRLPGRELPGNHKRDNALLSSVRAAVERAVAHVKSWRILSEEGGRYRAPLEKFPEVLAAVTGLINLRRFMRVAYE